MIRNERLYSRIFKRPLDILLSLTALLLVTPILLIICILVRVKLGRPILFKQQRPGLNGQIFLMYKFRTMTDHRDSNGELLPDNERLTKFGKFLRSTSLDELPELFNILKGDMSLVGPRPLLVQYLPLYNEHQSMRHAVRPGLTGYAQVRGRNAITWEEKFELDVKYVNNISFLGDCKIILLTVKKVLLREGIHSDTAATMEPFTGNEKGRADI